MAISTDGVGTKVLVAQMMDRYDTVGIDCVAMNVNDLICVGAEPISMVDYIAIQRMDPALLDEIAVGLEEGARRAKISISGGEIAQLPEIIAGEAGHNAFDLAGTAIGTVALDRIITGRQVEPGDVVVGIESNGVHSNGLTLARRVLLSGNDRLDVRASAPGLEGCVGDELLRPTHIYVQEVVEMLAAGLQVRGLAHITSDGFLNLRRLTCDCGYVIDDLPEVPPIFRLIRERGRVDWAEMFSVFNMGIGFCLIVPPSDAGAVIRVAAEHGKRATAIGRTTHDPSRTVSVPAFGLVGIDNHRFVATGSSAGA